MPGQHDITSPQGLDRPLSARCGDHGPRDATPSPVKLRAPEALGLARWDALDQAAVGQPQLVQRLVVVSDQRRRDDGHQPRVALEARRPHVR